MSNSVIIYEFKFFNEKYPLISKDELDECLKKVTETNNAYFTNEFLQKAGYGLEFKYEKQYGRPSELYVKFHYFKFPFSIDTFNKCKQLYKGIFFDFKLSPNKEKFIDNSEFAFDNIYKGQMFTSWDEFILYTIENGLEVEKSYAYEYLDKFVTDKNYKVITLGNESVYGVKLINGVGEVRINDKNYRLAILKSVRYNDFGSVQFKSYREDSPVYNLIDEGRITFRPERYANMRNFYLDIRCNETEDGKILINFNKFKAMERQIEDILRNKEIIITPQVYKYFDRYAIDDSDLDYDERNIPVKERTILKQYIKILKNGKPIKINNVIISKDTISNPDDDFKFVFNTMIDVTNIRVLNKIREQIVRQNYNLNSFYEELLKLSEIRHIVNTHNNTVSYGFIINDVTIQVSETGGTVKVNNMRCRKMDVFHILEKAICFTNTKEFNMYVKDVAHIGVTWCTVINNGILLNINCDFGDILKNFGFKYETLTIRFSFIRDNSLRSKIYLMANGKQFEIRYKGEFLRRFNTYQATSYGVNDLFDTLNQTLAEFDKSILGDLINNALEELKLIKQRGEELVSQTIKLTKAEETTIEIGGRKMIGYLLLGRVSGNKFFIIKDDLSVYKFSQGAWNRRCVVDDYRKHRIFEDRLANRLVNIYNEPARIHTIHDKE